MEDFTPVACPDLGEAGSVWRTEKLKDFAWRARCLGLDSDPEISQLIAQMEQETHQLEELWKEQQKPEYQQPWWQDGEYDAARADEANDAGFLAFSTGNLSQAFDAFTEAIRLWPTIPVYHCNRAAVALKLGRSDIAAEDAEHALTRDSGYVQAHLRAGKAYLALQQPQAAVQSFQQCLECLHLNPNKAHIKQEGAAKAGLKQAQSMLEGLERLKREEKVAAEAAQRPALSRHALDPEAATMQLLSAEAMLQANPELEAARFARLEALILCERYSDALSSLISIGKPQAPPVEINKQNGTGLGTGSAEVLYLEAEALWRSGNLNQAATNIKQACLKTENKSEKCKDLSRFVDSLQEAMAAVDVASEQGRDRECMESCTAVLHLIKDLSCTELRCKLLKQRAVAAAGRQLWGEALHDLDLALAATPDNAECLQLRAEVHRSARNYTESFLDYQKLSRVAPGMVGLDELLAAAARLCLQHNGSEAEAEAVGGSSRSNYQQPSGSSAFDMPARQMLCVSNTACNTEVRKAYYKLAARWHPDKWAAGSEEEQAVAAETFKQVQAAYEALKL